MSGSEECDKQYTYKPLSRRAKRIPFWNKLVDKVMSDGEERIAAKVFDEVNSICEDDKTWRNQRRHRPTIRQISSYLYRESKYEKTTQLRKGPNNKWLWVMIDDV